LTGADLTDANLAQVHALGTQFKEAILTGACIEGWEINGTTKLAQVVCDYIYVQCNPYKRYPQSGFLKNGDFSKLFAKSS
jgi:Pentapeptide repeats (8 copies)